MKVAIGSPGRFHIFDLARQMERLGHLSCIYTGYPRFKVGQLPRERVRTFPWLMAPKMAAARFGLNGLSAALNRPVVESFDQWLSRSLSQCDVFHCLSGFGLSSGRRARERYHAVTVCDRGSSHIQYQDALLREEYERWGVPYAGIDPRMIERELREYDESDLITIPSEFAYRSFVEKGVPETKLRKLPYGVDLSLFRPTRKSDDVFRVIYVGRMTLQKGLPYLLDAILSEPIPNLELWLIGPCLPEARPFLARYEGRYRYFGIIQQARLSEYYSQGSVFVMASIQEGLAMVQAQAMACGLPVIATTNTGAEDLFTNGLEGFIVPIRDAGAIREKILYLYEHPDVRNEMANAALARVRAIGGWDSYGESAAAVYGQALKRLRE
jgi:glycosyltransferase involved in cell wall biosynthesis